MEGDGDLTPAMVFSFYKTRLTEVLSKHNPAGLSTIGTLLKQFPGKEHQVYVQICKKCGTTPVNPPTSADFVDGQPKAVVQEPPDGRVKKWLQENNFEKYATQHQFLTMSWESFIQINTKGRLIELGVIPRQAQALLDAIVKQASGSAQPGSSEPASKSKDDFEVGENCYTKVVTTSKAGEKWLNARVTHVNDDNTYDIFVYNSKAHGVPPEAVNVPRNMLKKSTEKVQVAVPDPKGRAAKRPQFQQGDRVRVFGLRSHTSYNGLCGTVLLYVPSERRYQVRLDTNDVIAIKQRNVAPEHGDAPKDSSEAAKKKKNKGGPKPDDQALSDLMAKLMADNPDADPGKLGEFAAGYLLAKQKLNTGAA